MAEAKQTALDKSKAPQFAAPAIAKIENDIQLVAAADTLKEVKAYIERVETFFAPHKKRAHEAWKALCADEKTMLKPAEDAEVKIKTAMAEYREEQDRLAREEAARDAEAARIEEERRLLEEAAALELEAQRTGDADMARQAQELLDTPVETPAVVQRPSTPKIAGVSFRENWKAVVTDVKKLIQHVAKTPADTNLLTPNQTALNQMARSQRENMKIDGVKAVKDTGVASGR